MFSSSHNCSWRFAPVLALGLLLFGAGAHLRAADPVMRNFVLTDHVGTGGAPEYSHHVSYPSEMLPANLEGLFWVTVDPQGKHSASPMYNPSLRVHTPVSGTYHVYVELRGRDVPRVVSNVVDIPFDTLAAGVADSDAADKTKALTAYLAGTKWFWEGSKEHVLELRKDGKADLDYWRSFTANWKVIGPNQFKFTILTGTRASRVSTVTMSADLGSFAGTAFNQKLEISPTPRALEDDSQNPLASAAPGTAANDHAATAPDAATPLAEFLAGTKWYWQGSKEHVLEFRRDGVADLDYWGGLNVGWKVTGPAQVTFTIRAGPRANRTSLVLFNQDRSSFDGTAFNGNGAIGKSVRVPDNPAASVSTREQDPAKVMLVLTDHAAGGSAPSYSHHVSYPAETKPPTLDNIFWVTKDPLGKLNAVPMENTTLRVFTPIRGTYQVQAEYRGPGGPRVMSNVVAFDYTPPAAADNAKPFAAFLAGTKWLWEGSDAHVIEFRKDGKADLDFWKASDIGWKVTGPNRVRFTILPENGSSRSANIVFGENQRSFTGINFDANRPIRLSSRINEDDSQAAPSGAGR